MSILPVSLMLLVHVPVMLGMLFDMEHLCALTSESLLSNFIGAVSCSFSISRFRTQHLTQYYILHRDCILYLFVKIYMIQSNKYGSVQHETAKWGKPGKEGPVQKCRINVKVA